MSGLTLIGIGKRFGPVWAVRPADLEIRSGEFVVIMGPSGCGKSTLLRLIAGLEDPSCGSVNIGGRDVTNAAPAARGVAMVFQSYALYPHLTVAENIAFPLKAAKRSKDEIRRRVEVTARTLELGDLLDRKPRELSGGQRQRVSIGRAIVREPDVLLLDEPLSNLDAGLRVRLRREFARLHQTLNATMVYVTHDQQEAMSLADRIVVMEAGRVAQIGSPVELYENPASLSVATTIGSPPMNGLPATWSWEDGRVVALFNGARIAFDDVRPPEGSARGDAIIGVRPEHVRLDEAGWIVGKVALRELLGGVTLVHLTGVIDDGFIAQIPPDRAVAVGETLRLSIVPGKARLFDAATGLAFPTASL